MIAGLSGRFVMVRHTLPADQRRLQPFVFSRFPAFVIGSYGSPETQNIENAAAHAQSITPLAAAAAQQMPAMRQRCGIAYGLHFLWLLQRTPGPHRRRRLTIFDPTLSLALARRLTRTVRLQERV
jgi:hypothetical protein